MTTMKERIIEMADKQRASTFDTTLKSNPDMALYVQGVKDMLGTRNTSETVRCIVTNEMPSKCPCGKVASYISFKDGYRKYCENTCPAKGKAHSSKMKEVWKDQDKLDKMNETRMNTMQDRYQANGPMQVDEFKQKWITNHANKTANNHTEDI